MEGQSARSSQYVDHKHDYGHGGDDGDDDEYGDIFTEVVVFAILGSLAHQRDDFDDENNHFQSSSLCSFNDIIIDN